jgi:predicted secreted protein
VSIPFEEWNDRPLEKHKDRYIEYLAAQAYIPDAAVVVLEKKLSLAEAGERTWKASFDKLIETETRDQNHINANDCWCHPFIEDGEIVHKSSHDLAIDRNNAQHNAEEWHRSFDNLIDTDMEFKSHYEARETSLLKEIERLRGEMDAIDGPKEGMNTNITNNYNLPDNDSTRQKTIKDILSFFP